MISQPLGACLRLEARWGPDGMGKLGGKNLAVLSTILLTKDKVPNGLTLVSNSAFGR